VQLDHTIEIEKIISGGNGMGRLQDGMTVMVPFVLPGEVVTIRERKRFSGHIQAELLHLERSNHKRQAPFCPQYETCGGCSLQHTSYQNQLSIKEKVLSESLSRNKIEPEKPISSPLPSPLTQGYRFTIRVHLDAKGVLGFHKKQSHSLVAISNCPLATPAINTTLLRLQQSQLAKELAGFCNQLEITCSPLETSITVTLHLSTPQQPAKSLLEKLLSETEIQSVALTFRRKTTFFPQAHLLQQQFSFDALHYTLGWDSRCFFQVNPKQNQQLVALTLQQAGTIAGKKILDLFCGMGNFSIPLGCSGAEISGVEHNQHATRAAQNNAKKNGLLKSRFIAADVRHYLQQSKKNLPQSKRGKAPFDLILLDPPRQGLGKTTRLLSHLEAQQIIYISCDPATLCRDIKTLTTQGYRLKAITPVDMFPHTHHIESLAVLEKN